MYCLRQILPDLWWVGGNDRRIALFENVFPVPRGISYNSYLLLDEKTVLLDTVDKAAGEVFFDNLEHLLGQRPLDYVVVNHMEPDHCATLADLLRRHPETTVVGNTKTFQLIQQFFGLDLKDRSLVVAEGDQLSVGSHTFRFLMMPMVHWPEAMASFEESKGILFSADAFGSFGALSGSLFADEVNLEKDWMDECRRYYANIVGKYGAQVQAVLKKAAALGVQMICPLHGLIWRSNLSLLLDKYQKWSTYTSEDQAVLIPYASVYGHTETAAEALACRLADAGVTDVSLYDVSAIHPSYIVSEAFRCSHIVLASTTYNGGIFCNMETLLTDLKAHALQNRTVAIVENGSWGPMSGRLMREMVGSMKNMTLLEQSLTLRSALAESQYDQLDALAKAIAASVNSAAAGKAPVEEEKTKGFRCSVCGYVYEGDSLPEGYTCPVCHVGADHFAPIP